MLIVACFFFCFVYSYVLLVSFLLCLQLRVACFVFALSTVACCLFRLLCLQLRVACLFFALSTVTCCLFRLLCLQLRVVCFFLFCLQLRVILFTVTSCLVNSYILLCLQLRKISYFPMLLSLACKFDPPRYKSSCTLLQEHFI